MEKIADCEELQREEIEEEEEDLEEDLEEEKQKLNEFNVEGNRAVNQAFIQTLNISANYIMDVEKENKKQTKKFDLQKKEDCINFIENYKKSDYLAVAVILCVFEAVTVGDLPKLMVGIIEYLPDIKVNEKDLKSISNNFPDSYISLDTILQTIGAKHLSTMDGQHCISLGINTVDPLKNVWEAFPVLRQVIISWLLSLVERQGEHSVFGYYQIVTAVSKVVSLDIRIAEQQVFPTLYGGSQHMWLLGNVVFKLYEKNINREYWDKLIIKWLKVRNGWIWRASYLTYALFVENEINNEYTLEIKKLLAMRIYSLKRSDIIFVLNYLFLSDKIRTSFCEILDMAFKNGGNKEQIAVKYLLILRNGFYRIQHSRIELPLLICDEKKQQVHLRGVISYIMGKYSLRKQLYRILEVYIKEITNYKYSEKISQYIAAYFCNMALAGKEYIEENRFFLEKCECELAQSVAEILNRRDR